MPRVTIYKSNKYIIVQAIDDTAGNTLVFLNTGHIENKLPSIKKIHLPLLYLL
jgi:large subunit ribosomal protein L18